MFPHSNPDRWAAFVSGSDPLPLSVLNLDSLSLNELSIALEMRSSVSVSPGALAVLQSAEELSSLLESSQSVQFPGARELGTWRRTVRRVIIERLLDAFNDSVRSATPRKFMRIYDAVSNASSEWSSRLSIHRFVLEFLTKYSTVEVHADQIQRAGQIFHDTGLTLWSTTWTRRRCARDVIMYRQSAQSETASCVIAFGGGFRQPMMPISLFLAALGDYTDTVFLVRSKPADAFRRGISGLGSDIETAFANLVKVVGREVREEALTQKPPVVLGTSGGGIPALIFSQFLSRCRAVLVGPNSTRDPRWANNETLTRALDSHSAAVHERRAVPVTIVYGDIGNDVQKVPDWQTHIAGAQIVKIPGADHNALLPLVERGTFQDAMRIWATQIPPAQEGRS